MYAGQDNLSKVHEIINAEQLKLITGIITYEDEMNAPRTNVSLIP